MAKGPTPEQELEFRKADSHRQLGVDHLIHHRPEMALRELLLSDRLNPSHPRTHHALAQAYLAKDKNAEAEANLLSALASKPDFHEARFDLTTLYVLLEALSNFLRGAQVTEMDRIEGAAKYPDSRSARLLGHPRI